MLKQFGITIKEVLRLPAYQNVKLLGGEGGLERVARNVNVMEVPDILPWLKKGDFILTTGYAIKDDAEAQKRLIPQLAALGVTGLAIKPKRYIESIPPYMIEQANNLSLPLLELSIESNFSDLISSILTQIVNRQAAFMEHSLKVHQQFTDLILQGGELNQIVRALADLLGAFVRLEDTVNLRSAIFPEIIPVEIESHLEKENTEGISDTDTPNGLIEHQISIGGQPAHFVALPVVFEGKKYGCVKSIVLERKFSYLDLLTIERVCSIVALDILRHHGLVQVEQKYKAELLNQILTTNNPDEKNFIERGKLFHWDLSGTYAAILISILPKKTGGSLVDIERAKQAAKTQAIPLMEDYCRRNGLIHMLVANEIGILLLVQPLCKTDKTDAWLKRILRQMRNVVSKWDVTIGVGGCYSGLHGIKNSYREAKIALEVGAEIFGAGSDIFYNELGIYGLLLRQASVEEQKAFVCQVLGPLLDYDLAKQAELFSTLQVFLEMDCNIKKTAQTLFTHYNTILYRLNKIKELTRLDINNLDQKLTLQVAVRLFPVFNRYNDI